MLRLATFTGITLASIAVVSPAAATEAPQYTTVAWVIDNPADIWSPPQHTPVRVDGAAVDFAGVQALVGCGREYQFDGYNAGEVTESLIAGGVLYGPNNPTEALADGAPGTEATGGTPWTYYSAPDCTETACIDSYTQATTTYRWTWDGTGVVRTDTGTTPTPLTEADAITVGCLLPTIAVVPAQPVAAELPVTGNDSLWLILLAAVLSIGGLLMVGGSLRKGVRS